ncbi:MAG TPA: FAD-dependent oxidoreductase [Thermoleophilaceae bacterium]
MTTAAGSTGRSAERPGEGGRVAVVGGGVSGVAAAHRLRAAGFEVDLVEREDVLGGRSAEGRLEERWVTFGGKNIGSRYRRFRAFAAEHGCGDFEPFGVNSSRAEGDRLITVDSSRRWKTALSTAQLGSPRDLARLVRLAMAVRREEGNRFLGSPLSAELGERHDHAPLSDHFGPRLVRRLLRPVVVRMNGAEPDEAYLGNFPSNLGMMLQSYEQLSHGMRDLFERFGERAGAVTGTAAEGLVVDGGSVTGLELRAAGADARREPYDAVVLATPAPISAGLVRPHHAGLADLLERVTYHPAAVVLARYERPVMREDVRALVFDDGPVSNAGAYGVGDLDLVRYTFSGRDARPLLERGPEELLDAAEERLVRHFPDARADRRREVAWRRWDRAYCAYLPYHGRFLADVRRMLGELPRLHLAGDYLRGASIEACFKAGEDCAAEVAARFSRERSR